MEQSFCVTRGITTLLQSPLDLFADAKEMKKKKKTQLPITTLLTKASATVKPQPSMPEDPEPSNSTDPDANTPDLLHSVNIYQENPVLPVQMILLTFREKVQVSLMSHHSPTAHTLSSHHIHTVGNI